MNKTNKIFKAIADQKRRDILHLLIAGSAALTIHQISDRFEVSRQAITKHIYILEDAGLVDIVQEGRERLCHANPMPLKEVQKWLAHYEKFWDDKLQSLGGFLDNV